MQAAPDWVPQVGEVMVMGPAAISKHPKPPVEFLETQKPVSHKQTTVTWVEEPAVENLKTWTKDKI